MKTMLRPILFSAMLSFSLTNTGICQINWSEHLINDNSDYVLSVFAVDIENDGDVDVLEAAYNDGIKWWENDGSQNFAEHSIDALFGGANDVFAIDLDGDGDTDVLGAAYDDDDIAWWENDGSQVFTKHTIDGDFDGARSVYPIDLDNDNDLDILGISRAGSQVAWWENDGTQNFTKHVVDDYFYHGREIHAIDLDGDEDIDILGAAGGGAELAWWENDGDQNFTKHSIEQGAGFAGGRCVYAIDIDSDNDMDVLGTAAHINTIAWWENDGSQNFTKHIISDSFIEAITGYAVDLDSDGDIDVYGNSYFRTDEPGNKISWWENDGSQNFIEHTIALDFVGSRDSYAIDLDSDGDIDILGGASTIMRVSWWESDLSQQIPTLSEWGMLIMGLLLLAVGTVAVVRKRRAAPSKAA